MVSLCETVVYCATLHWENKRGVTLRQFDIIYDVIYPIPSNTINRPRNVILTHKNVMNVCKYPHYSHIFGGKSAMQWWKAENYRRFQRPLFCLLCLRNEIDPHS